MFEGEEERRGEKEGRRGEKTERRCVRAHVACVLIHAHVLACVCLCAHVCVIQEQAARHSSKLESMCMSGATHVQTCQTLIIVLRRTMSTQIAGF